jgi:hypothetical protein
LFVSIVGFNKVLGILCISQSEKREEEKRREEEKKKRRREEEKEEKRRERERCANDLLMNS